jgi:hypothetical protein
MILNPIRRSCHWMVKGEKLRIPADDFTFTMVDDLRPSKIESNSLQITDDPEMSINIEEERHED